MDFKQRDIDIKHEYNALRSQHLKTSYIKTKLGDKYGLHPETIHKIATNAYPTRYNGIEFAKVNVYNDAKTMPVETNRIVLENVVKRSEVEALINGTAESCTVFLIKLQKEK